MTCAPTLFNGVGDSARQKLAESSMGGLRPGEKVVDLFCGAGGWGEGAKLLGIPVDFAVNHWPVAIDTHRTNNPDCEHRLGDAWRAKPRDVIGNAKLGLLLASAACTTHSRARGAAPVSKRVHMLGWCIARWMKEASPRLVMIENVPEWNDWGPLIPKRDGRGRAMKDEQGRPIMVQCPNRKGQHYRALLRYMRKLGYTVDEFIGDAPDFGEASRRKRLFIQCRNDGAPIVWPEKTYGKAAARPHRSAAECIDWSDLGRSIFDRRQALKPKTQARIAEGIRRYVIADPAPFILRVTQSGAEGKGWHVSPSDQPFPTQTTRQDLAVATPVMATTRNGERDGQALRCHHVTDPLMTVTGGAVQGVATPILAPQNGGVYGGRCDQPGPTVTTKGHQALIAPVLSPAGGTGRVPQPIGDPMRTVMPRESYGVAIPVVQVFRAESFRGCSARDVMPTITAGNGPGRGGGAGHAMGIATPVMAVCAHGEGAGGTKRWGRPAIPVTGPLNAIHAGGNNFGLATPVLAGAGGSAYAGKPTRIEAPLETVKCDDRRSLATPVLMNNTSGHTGGRADVPAPTVTTGGQAALVTPIVSYMRHGGGQHSDTRQPLGAILAGATHAHLLCPLLADYYGNSTTLHQVGSPLGAVTTLDRHATVNVVMSSWELQLARGRRVAQWLVQHLGDAVSIDPETGLAFTMIDGIRRFFVDILFRMLKPRELARAMGFPDSYIWPKTQRDTVRLIGNAVSVRTAAALLSACLPRGLIQRRRRKVAA